MMGASLFVELCPDPFHSLTAAKPLLAILREAPTISQQAAASGARYNRRFFFWQVS